MIESAEIRPIFDRYFVLTRVTVQENGDKRALNTPGGEDLAKQLGGLDGLPFFAFVDRQGGLIVNSLRPKDLNGKHGGNIGHPVQPYEIDYFMTMIAKAAPEMAAAERSAIEKWLRSQKDAVSAQLREEVRLNEIALAKAMADRDAKAFASFLAQEAVFISNRGTGRGAKIVTQMWARYFTGLQAQFSWEPERVEVVESGTLAMTSGPVRDPAGKRTGTFHSVWRHEASGQWKIVFDDGRCDAPAK